MKGQEGVAGSAMTEELVMGRMNECMNEKEMREDP